MINKNIGILTWFYGKYILISALLVLPLILAAQFTEMPTQISNTGNLNWIDYDNDNDLDLHVGTHLYINNSGSFTNSGITFERADGMWLDYDFDGDQDYLGCFTNPASMYINQGGSFSYQQIQFPLLENQTFMQGIWGDFDNDSDTDFACMAPQLLPSPHIIFGTWNIYRNNQGIFTYDVISEQNELVCDSGNMSIIDVDNNGILDLFFTGSNESYDPITQLFSSRNFNSFILSRDPLGQMYGNIYHDSTSDGQITSYSSALWNALYDWGDYNENGRLDLLISGYHEDWQSDLGEGSICLNTYLYAGLYDDMTDNVPAASFSGYEYPAMKWGDMDNDGDQDALVSNHIYYNSIGGFTEIGCILGTNGANYSAVGDYDNDGDLDVAISTNQGLKLFRNDVGLINNAPSAPNVSINSKHNGYVRVEPSGSIDDHTTLMGLSYHIRAGSAPGIYDIVCPPSNPVNGSCNTATRGYNPLIAIAPGDTIYVAAQAVDYSYKGSPFSTEIQYVSPALHLLYPNGGEMLYSGRTSYIQWEENDVYSLNVQLSPDNGNNWINICASPVPSLPGIYYYSVPIVNSTQCIMKISLPDDGSFTDSSDQFFTITSSASVPSVNLTYPLATNIFFTPGQEVGINWTSTNISAVNIDFSTDNGYNWTNLVTSYPAAISHYLWTVPDTLTNMGRIRICSSINPGNQDYSDNSFTITKIIIISPNGGETYTANYSSSASVCISVIAPYLNALSFSYTTNGGDTWSGTSTVYASRGYFEWTPPALESDQCMIKLIHPTATQIGDVSDDYFSIRIPVKFINANGGGFVNNNYYYKLRWENIDIDPTTQVYIEYNTSGSYWGRPNPDSVPVSDLSDSLFLALENASQVRFRMLDSLNGTIVAMSESFMTITGKTLHIATPATGETLAINSYTTISWDADGCTNLDILYTSDFGETWLPIASGIPSTDLNYVWHVPNVNSTQCRIKIQDNTYSYMNIESDGEFSIVPMDFIANFSATPTTGYSDLVVQFTDQSIGYITSWAWDFQNDGIVDSNEQHPVFTYRQSGFYSVALTISDGSTDLTITRNNYIYVLPMEADFTATATSGFVPLTVQFTDITPSDVTVWQWDFDADGVIDSNSENPFWTFIFPWIYSVSQHVTNGLDSDSETKIDYISASLDPLHTLYVPSQYLTIQAAIDAAVDGDYIIIADGTYYENIIIEGKNITLASYFFIDGDSTHIANTIIDGGQAINPDQASTITILPGSGRTVISPDIDGFTIRNGSGRRILQNIGGNTIEKRVGGGIYINQVNPVLVYNKIEDNDADDEGGGSYAFQSIPNLGGMVNADIGLQNPGNNEFRNNQADLGADIYIEGVTFREEIKLHNCSFEVFSEADTTVSNYWANADAPLSFIGCSGTEPAINSDIYVATNGSDTQNTGLSPDSPFKTIDHALSRAYGTMDNPLTIHIASGTYSPSLTGEKFPLQMVKYVSLQGTGTDETFLDAEASADEPCRVLNLDKVEGVNISNLTLMGGFVTLAKNYNGGGIGIIESELEICNTYIAYCSSAGDGAGIYAFNSTLDADSLNVSYNSALGSGGGFAAVQSNVSLGNSSIKENSVSKNGAGISADAGLINILGCSIVNNLATGYQSKGGGVVISNTANALFRNNLLRDNKADNGAGLYLQNNSSIHLDRNTICNNLADFNGGGMFVNTTDGIITNNLIANNSALQRGGAYYGYSSPQIVNNTIAYNKASIQGGGMYLNSGSPVLSNSILWHNVVGSGNTLNQIHLFTASADPAISYCDLQGGSMGITTDTGVTYEGIYQNNLDADPMFIEIPGVAGYDILLEEGDFNLQMGSPCLDTGDPDTNIDLFAYDLSGNARIDNNCIDMGAYEKVHIIGPLIQANPEALNYGRVNIHGTPQTLELSLVNTGTMPLLVSELAWETYPSPFSYSFNDIIVDILPGQSAIIEVTYAPSTTGNHINTLIINNNSLNQPILRIPVSGIGIDANTSIPGNIQLAVIGDDIHLSWEPVTTYPNGDPFTPDGYIVLYSENADEITDNYFYLFFTEDTCYNHVRVARYRNKMFYKVIAVSDMPREIISVLSAEAAFSRKIKWAELRESTIRKL